MSASSAPRPHPERTSASAKKVVFADLEGVETRGEESIQTLCDFFLKLFIILKKRISLACLAACLGQRRKIVLKNSNKELYYYMVSLLLAPDPSSDF